MITIHLPLIRAIVPTKVLPLYCAPYMVHMRLEVCGGQPCCRYVERGEELLEVKRLTKDLASVQQVLPHLIPPIMRDGKSRTNENV